jgi:hypothetical protein
MPLISRTPFRDGGEATEGVTGRKAILLKLGKKCNAFVWQKRLATEARVYADC